MKHILKEVFKSIFKNKVVLFALTVLIFLTTGIFALLNDTSRAMTNQYYAFRLKSNQHHYTLDLNQIPINGSAANGGYSVNGKLNDSVEPIRYVEDNYKKVYNLLNLEKIAEDPKIQQKKYIPISLFGITRQPYASRYIHLDDFTSMYNLYNSELPNNAQDHLQLLFDETQTSKRIRFLKKYNIKTYTKNSSNQFTLNVKNTNVNPRSNFTFRRLFRLSDIANINRDIRNTNVVIFTQFQPLYLNLANNTATFDTLEMIDWRNSNIPFYQVPTSFVARALGLSKYQISNSSDEAYSASLSSLRGRNLTLANFSNLVINPDDEASQVNNSIFNIPLKSFVISNLVPSVSQVRPQETIYDYYTFEAGSYLTVPTDWVKYRENYTFFSRYFYETTYDPKDKESWKGAYRKYIENQIANSNGKTPEELKPFNYFVKQITTLDYSFDPSNPRQKIINTSGISTSNLFLGLDEVNNIQLKYLTDTNPNTEISRFITNEPDYAKFSFDGKKTIAQIATNNEQNTLDYQTYLDLTNSQIAKDKYDYIKERTKLIVELNIFNSFVDVVESKNLANRIKVKIDQLNTDLKNKPRGRHLGIRETATVDGYVDGEKNVFHFVNVGDNDRRINGIPNNLNLLANENRNPRRNLLNKNADQLASAFRTKQLPPKLAAKILYGEGINKKPDDALIQSVIDYFPVRLIDYRTLKYRTLINQKVVYLGNYDEATALKNEAQFAGLGIVFLSPDTAIIVKPVYNTDKSQILRWENVDYTNYPNGFILTPELTRKYALVNNTPIDHYLTSQQLTIMAKINPNGWVRYNPSFPSTVFIPAGYRAPKADIINEARSSGTFKLAVEYIVRGLLQSDLIKEGFIAKDTLYSYSKVLEQSFTQNDFANTISSGSINLGTIPKIVIDTFYFWSHDPNGDYASKWFNDMFNTIIYKLKYDKSGRLRTLVEQRTYLKEQLISLFKLIEFLFGIKIDADTLFKYLDFIARPADFIESLKNIVAGFNIKKFTEFSNDFSTNVHGKTFDQTGEFEIKKLDFNFVNREEALLESVTLHESLIQEQNIAKALKLNNLLTLNPEVNKNPNYLYNLHSALASGRKAYFTFDKFTKTLDLVYGNNQALQIFLLNKNVDPNIFIANVDPLFSENKQTYLDNRIGFRVNNENPNQFSINFKVGAVTLASENGVMINDEPQSLTFTVNNRPTLYTKKFSLHEMLSWALKSIDSNVIKSQLYAIIDNIDFNSIAKFDGSFNPLVNLFGGSIPDPLKAFIKTLNAQKNPNSTNQFYNLKNLLKFFVKSYDFNQFSKIVDSKIKSTPLTVVNRVFYNEIGGETNVTENLILKSLETQDLIYAALKSLFATPGSSGRLKTELAKGLNLSNLGTDFAYNSNINIIIPADDPNKLDLNDLISLVGLNLGSLLNKNANPNSENRANTSDIYSFSFEGLENTLEFIADKTEINIEQVPTDIKNALSAFFGWNGTKYNPATQKYIKTSVYNQEDIVKTYNTWSKILNLFKLNSRMPSINTIESVSDIWLYFNNFGLIGKGDSNWSNNSLFSTFSTVVDTFIQPQIRNNFSLIKDSLWASKIWTEIFFNTDADLATKKAFALDLLALANNSQIINIVNNFNLSAKYGNNLAIYDSKNNFQVTKGLVETAAISSQIFATNSIGEFRNPSVRNLANKYPSYKQFLITNKYLITQAFAYNGQAQLYILFNKNNNVVEYNLPYQNVYASLVYLLITRVLANDKLYELQKVAGSIEGENVSQENVRYIDIVRLLIQQNYKVFSYDQIGIRDIYLNSILRNKFPNLILWTLTNSSADSASVSKNANLDYLVKYKLIDFDEVFENEQNAYDFINNIFFQNQINVKVSNPSFEKDYYTKLAIDNDYLLKLKELSQGEDPIIKSFFDTNLLGVLFSVMDTITGIILDNSFIRYTQSSSYIAKINQAYAEANHKRVYSGFIPNEPEQMRQLIEQLEKENKEEYLLNVNGARFLIVGTDLSFDYFYPLIDENNIQVNTNKQAIVYVNSNGFSRVQEINRGIHVKRYLTIQNPNIEDGLYFKNEDNLDSRLNKIVLNQLGIATNGKTPPKFIYKYTDFDQLNPERSLRITFIEKLVVSVNLTATILMVFFSILVAVSIVFIIKRYIASQNKVLGILMAQGYTPMQISSALTIFAFFTVGVGGTLGALIGYLLHGVALNTLSSFWTIPIQTLNFNIGFTIMYVAIWLVFVSLIIVLSSLNALKKKAIDLMSGIVELNIGEIHNKLQIKAKKLNVKSKFSLSLAFNGFWKLLSFAISIVLAGVTTIVGLSTSGAFKESINKTYSQRDYNFKYDLFTPTTEGGAINTAIVNLDNKQINDLENTLYVPIGTVNEIDMYQSGFFRPGISTAISKDNNGRLVNGNPTKNDGHILTQFSVNVQISSYDPWTVIYNQLPDSHRSRVLQIRNKVATILQNSQPNLRFNNPNLDELARKINIDETKKALAENNGHGFFSYSPNAENVALGSFKYIRYDKELDKLESFRVTNEPEIRKLYREFLVNGYKYLEARNNNIITGKRNGEIINELFVAINALKLFNDKIDETYSYAKVFLTNGDNQTEQKDKLALGASSSDDSNPELSLAPSNLVTLYGYHEDSKFVKFINRDGKNWLKEIIREYKFNNTKFVNEFKQAVKNYNSNSTSETLSKYKIPVIINHVSRGLHKLKIGDEFVSYVENNVNRFKYKLDQQVGLKAKKPPIFTFKIVGINPTYINEEFIIPQVAANIITGLDTLEYKARDKRPFNGVLSKSFIPDQILYSAAVYSPSGYSPNAINFDVDLLNDSEQAQLFNAIFGFKELGPEYADGALIHDGYTPMQIIHYLTGNTATDLDDAINKYKAVNKNKYGDYNSKFLQLYNKNIYTPLVSGFVSKDIEFDYIQIVSKTMQQIITSFAIISFAIAICILIIVSTILINENEKNIAILGVLGYTNREKIRVFFSIYAPFALIAVLISVGLAFATLAGFSYLLITMAQIAIPTAITFTHIIVTVVSVIAIFIIASFNAWRSIDKVKPIDLLKGK
ncbi:FtsX-like permease family protein [Mycoplasma corogypsi]|uniref:ABC transporter permease n=1 Tax=Mycoplasma corogypsi TaxID=2106 RepID=UPI0038735BAB